MKHATQTDDSFTAKKLEKQVPYCYFSGYASIFNFLDHHGDIILPGAFKFLEKEYVLLWQHQVDCPIGKITNIVEDINGLYVEAEINLGIKKAKDIYFMLKDKIINSFSIGYTIQDCEFIDGHRIINSLHLWEVSLVTFPANKMAKIVNIEGAPNICNNVQLDQNFSENHKDINGNLEALLRKIKIISQKYRIDASPQCLKIHKNCKILVS